MDWLSMLVGGTGRGWVEAVLLLGLFWAALAHPERIRSLFQLRLAVICLGLALIAPAMIQIFLIGQRPGGAPRPSVGGTNEMVMYVSAVPSLLIMVAVLLGVGSVTPRRLTPEG